MKNSPSPSRGFTLIELLVVIAIIGILAAMLMPVLGRAKRTAYTIACISNLHQIGIGFNIYVEENNSHLPYCPMLPSGAVSNQVPIVILLQPKIINTNVFHCPADLTLWPVEGCSYEWNYFLNGASFDRPDTWSPVTQQIVDTIFGGKDTTPLIGDANSFHPVSGVWTGRNALFFDGRVEKTKLQGMSSINPY